MAQESEDSVSSSVTMYRFFVIQGVSALLVFGGSKLGLWPVPSLAFLTLFQGVVAVLLTLLVKGPRWWLPLQFLFLPALWAMARGAIPAGWYGAGFVVLGLVYWNTFQSRVPLYLTHRETLAELDRLVREMAPRSFVDLGCGTGTVLCILAAHHPDIRFVGYEVAPIPWLIGKWKARALPNCTLHRKSFWNISLSEFDLAYAFLSPVPMPALGQKMIREMRSGTSLISNTFKMPGMLPHSIFLTEGTMPLYLYRQEGNGHGRIPPACS
ncbi:class I SAM-dependent methyltransferase [Ferrovum myxofaciens]|uniref:class I SAM-dependent methyltransferase n=1 Tax=Ferrovum myxofaciens TaxID=416213 RepID=UPI0023530A55|nr:class I SAM-dependent methyltransferase [Ferrovum myxofaciens]MBU6995835.1 class I SAM-dependent methyltransferase [Ferrovum myxofaciens]